MKKFILTTLCVLFLAAGQTFASAPDSKDAPPTIDDEMYCAALRKAVLNTDWVFFMRDEQKEDGGYFVPLPRKGEASFVGKWCITDERISKCGDVTQDIDYDCDGVIDVRATWKATGDVIVIDDETYVEFEPKEVIEFTKEGPK